MKSIKSFFILDILYFKVYLKSRYLSYCSHSCPQALHIVLAFLLQALYFMLTRLKKTWHTACLELRSDEDKDYYKANVLSLS